MEEQKIETCPEDSLWSIEELPFEIQEHILEKLDIVSVGVALRVNKTWNKLIDNRLFWQKL